MLLMIMSATNMEEGGDAYRKAQQNMQSSVCGHTHTKAGVQYGM